MSSSALELPSFNPVYAGLILFFVAGLSSLLKTRDSEYKILKSSDFANKSRFCQLRLQYWSVTFIFYYSSFIIATGVFILTTIFVSVIGAVRVRNDWLTLFQDISLNMNACNNTDINTRINDILNETQRFSNQLTWFLICIFIQKMFTATLLLQDGISTIISGIIMDPWLIVNTVWCLIIYGKLIRILKDDNIAICYNDTNNINGIKLVQDINTLCFNINTIGICLFTMFIMSLSVGILINYLFTSIRECAYGSCKENKTSNIELQTKNHQIEP